MTATVPGRGALARILGAAARGEYPPPDGSVTVVPQPMPGTVGVAAFCAHSVVFTDEDPSWVHDTLATAPSDPLAAPLCPPFLTAFAARTGRVVNNIDMVMVASALPGPPETALRPFDDPEHPRVARALRHRDDVRAWGADGGVVMLGRGVAGRWEVAVEVDAGARGRGLGRALALAARRLMPPGEPLWAQIAPGNAPSVRAFQSAGFRPVGAEALLTEG